MAVHKTTAVWHAGRRYQVRTLSKGLDEGCWIRASAGEGSKGERLYDWACVELEDGLVEAAILTDAEWERVRELLPEQKPGQGRPRRDDRQVLCGTLCVMYTGASWRELPQEECPIAQLTVGTANGAKKDSGV